MSNSQQPPRDETGESAPVLEYRTPVSENLVTLQTFGSSAMARVAAGQLESAGIACAVLDELTNALGIPYSGFASVKLQVRQCDLARAQAALAGAGEDAEDMEVAADGSATVIGPDGTRHRYVPVATYASAQALADAALRLGVARIDALAPKTDRSAAADGAAPALVLRVPEADAGRARQVLDETEEAADEPEPQCPACGSWQVLSGTVRAPLAHRILAAFALAPGLPQEWQCLRCQHRWPKPAGA